MNHTLSSTIERWRERRRKRRAERLERKNLARTTLRDYKKPTGDEGGPPGAF